MGTSILTYWYYHVPNFVLAALMYTLLGRAILGMFVDADSPNYIWRFFCRVTDPIVAAVALMTPKADTVKAEEYFERTGTHHRSAAAGLEKAKGYISVLALVPILKGEQTNPAIIPPIVISSGMM